MSFRLPASKVRSDFADTLNRVAYGKERIVLNRNGRDLVAIIPVDDLALLEAIENQQDLAAARTALNEPGTLPWDEVKRRLHLDGSAAAADASADVPADA